LKTRYLEDYFDRLYEEYPVVKESSVRQVARNVARSLTRFMRGGKRGVKIISANSIIHGKLPKRQQFIVTKVFSKQHLYGLIKRRRVMAINKKLRIENNGNR